MPNEIELTEILAPTLKGIEDYASAIRESSKEIGLVSPTSENADICAKKVTEINKKKKDGKAVLDSLKKKWDEPLNQALKPVSDALAEYVAIADDYSAKVLCAKKEAFKGKARESFLKFAKVASQDGSIPDFELFYETGWYGETQEQLEANIASKLHTEIHKDETVTAYFAITSSKEKVQMVRNFLATNLISFSE